MGKKKLRTETSKGASRAPGGSSQLTKSGSWIAAGGAARGLDLCQNWRRLLSVALLDVCMREIGSADKRPCKFNPSVRRGRGAHAILHPYRRPDLARLSAPGPPPDKEETLPFSGAGNFAATLYAHDVPPCSHPGGAPRNRGNASLRLLVLIREARPCSG